jgi:aspartate dehydrogenase
MSLKIGLVGCGAIGSSLATFIQKELQGHAKLSFIFDADKTYSERLAKRIRGAKVAASLERIIQQSDFLVEAASIEAAKLIVELTLQHEKQALLMSGGGLTTSPQLLKKIFSSQNRYYLPSGAIPGIDGLLAAKESKLEEVTLTTSKSLKSLQGAPFFDAHPKAARFSGPKKTIFQGNVSQAIRHFPKNLNVAALLAITGLGVNKTKVRVIAHKKLAQNIHEIHIKSGAGSMTIQTKNFPHPDNPRTSGLAIYSAQALLRKIFSPLSLGT